MKKLAFAMVMLALGTVTFAGCAKDDKAATDTTATSETEDGSATTDQGDAGTTDEGTTEETGETE